MHVKDCDCYLEFCNDLGEFITDNSHLQSIIGIRETTISIVEFCRLSKSVCRLCTPIEHDNTLPFSCNKSLCLKC